MEQRRGRWLQFLPSVQLILVLAVSALLFAMLALPTLASAQTFGERRAFGYFGVHGFMPMSQSYRINYTTSTFGLPFELSAGMLLPIAQDGYWILGVRQLQREAQYDETTTVSVLQLEPGVRWYLERAKPEELRVFGATGIVLDRSTFESRIEARNSEEDRSTTIMVRQSYYNVGGMVELGLSYPLSSRSVIEGVVHISVLIASSMASGGLGNTGGVSIGAVYRYGF